MSGQAWLSVREYPLFSVAITLLAFQFALWLYRRSGWLVLQPVMISMLLVIVILLAFGVDYSTYRQGVSPISLLLGPATVALAVPVFQNLQRIRQLLWPILITLVVGGVLTVLLTVLIGYLLGVRLPVLVTLSTKSVTMPIAMLMADQAGGIASLAALLVMLTGVIGAAFGPLLLGLARVDHLAARGMSYGMNAHAIGTVRALEEGDECGAFAALAMSLLGLLTAVVLPLCAGWLGSH